MLGTLISPCIKACCASRAGAFAAAIQNGAAAQVQTLSRIIAASAATDYGQSVGLTRGMSVDAFRNHVPVTDYAALAPWIDLQHARGTPALAPGRVRCFEPTSGSGGAAKRIPYNDALLGAFRSLFSIWVHDLLQYCVRPRSGRLFISLSSPLRSSGFDDDREYLSPAIRVLLAPLLVLPAKSREAESAEAFRDALCCALLSRPDLEFMSIWNPGYLLILMEHFIARRHLLLPRIARAQHAPLDQERPAWEAVWPKLQLISCWTAAAAAAPARRLARLLPHAQLQGKGLIATEAPVTVPLSVAGGCVPLVDEVFLEFEDTQGDLHLLHEVRAGNEYALIVTQPGGLLRYRLGDLVRVTGHYHGTPLLEFAGRADAVSDLVGEKLSEDLVAQALQRIARNDAYCTLLPLQATAGPATYCLLTDEANPAFAQQLEDALQAAFRYREARLLGQLSAVTAIIHPRMRYWVQEALESRGVKSGDIKDRPLFTALDCARHVHDHVANRYREAR